MIKQITNKLIDIMLLKKLGIFIKKNLPQKESLLKLVDKEKKTNKQTREILKKKAEPIWIPSVTSFLKISGVVLIFWFLSHPQFLYSWITSPVYNLSNYFFGKLFYYQKFVAFFKEFISYFSSLKLPVCELSGNHYQNLIAIHAGIGAVLIGLAFFVAQSLADKNDSEKGKVLLYKSCFFPLLTAEILTFSLFLWGDINILSIIPIVGLAIFTILSLGRVIIILLKDYEMEKAKKEMFFSIIKKSFIKILDHEITKRFGNNKLKEKLKDTKIVELNPFGPLDEDDYISIKSHKSGIFTDLFFNKLNQFIAELKKVNSQNKNLIVNFDTGVIENNSVKSKREHLCYLSRMFYSEIKNGDELFWIKKDLFSKEIEAEEKNRIIKKLENLAQDIFTIKEVMNPEEEAKDEVSKVKDRCIVAITNKKTGELRKIIRLYLELIKEFFNYLELYGGGFSSEQAEKERGNFFERLKPIEWLSSDVREVFERGMQSRDEEIIREIAYLPILLAQRAIENKDNLIFQEFIYFPQLLYSYAFEEKKNKNEKLANFMFDRAWRYLKELSDFHLEPMLKKGSFSEEDFKGFSIYLLKIFQSLLKNAVDNRDIDNFRIFLSKVLKLFEYLNTFSYGYDKDKITEVFKYLDQRRKQMVLGLASWVVHLWEAEKDKDVSILKDFFNETINKLPIKIEDFTKVFLDSHEFEVEKFWGWDKWEMNEKGEGEVHSIQILEKLEKIYAINALILLQSKSDEEIKKIKLPYSRDLAFLAEGARDLVKVLDNIENNPKNWAFVLNDNAIKKIQALKNLLQKAKQEQEEADLKRKRETSISVEKIIKFKESVVKYFYKNATLRKILKHYELYEDESNKEYSDDLKGLGINILFDKSPFFDNKVAWHIHFIGIDNSFNFGRSMANGENNEILGKIKEKCVQVEEKDFEVKLGTIKKLSNNIIIATNSAIWKFFEKSPNYMAKWNQKFPKQNVEEIEGLYVFNGYSIPVYQVYDNDKKSYIFILDKTNLGQLVQYSPLDKKDDKNFKEDIFFMNIQEFSNILSEAKKITGNPKWLEEVGSEEKQLEYLQERVLIHIFEKFEYNIDKGFEGYKLILES